MLEQVLPYAMVLDLNGNFVASPLLTEAPTLDNGGITQNPFTITYHLNPNANWSDGTPITSSDFDFTWRAILNTTGAYTTTGYNQIKSIVTTDPKVLAHLRNCHTEPEAPRATVAHAGDGPGSGLPPAPDHPVPARWEERRPLVLEQRQRPAGPEEVVA